jgi:hypothetical protein
MPQEDSLTYRKSLDEICRVPPRSSRSTAEKHVWAEGNDQATRARDGPSARRLRSSRSSPCLVLERCAARYGCAPSP